MDKESILKKAQNEKDEREELVQTKMMELTGIVMTALIVLFGSFLSFSGIIKGEEFFISHELVVDILMFIAFAGWAVQGVYLYKQLGNKTKLASGILYTCFSVALMVVIILQFIEVL